MGIQSVDHYELIQQLTNTGVASQLDNRRRLNDFAFELGWRPSDQLDLPGTEEFASGHLVVEHGLQNSAVISFLRKPASFPSLDLFRQKMLLNASYNNLIDWHIAVDYEGASFVYNRATPPRFYSYRRQLARDRTSHLSSYEFDSLSTDHPSPSVLPLDAALIRTISDWKRKLSAELRSITNEEISALFNSIILVRALEDYHIRRGVPSIRSLTQRLQENGPSALSQLLTKSIEAFTNSDLPKDLFDVAKIEKFDSLDYLTVREFLDDFYRNRYEPYFNYDFAMMSKHALSRIYEHYVSLLRFDEDERQKSLFPALPNETIDRSFGNIYTPEFIARFFAKYLRKELPLSRFQKLVIGDPACGSGIFLRAMLEMKFEALLDSFTTQSIVEGFESVSGIDIDANACAAARLSLSLLSLVLTGIVPKNLDIRQADTLELLSKDRRLKGSLDATVTNPPFVNADELPSSRKDSLLSFLGSDARGKTDLYLGFLKAGLAMLKPDGFGLFVLPKNFLISDNAAPLRKELCDLTTLHCVVDLSAVRVFEDVGAYVVLVIFQKRKDQRRPVMVVRCEDLVGSALEDALQAREVRNSSYEIFWAAQPTSSEDKWRFVSPEKLALQSKLGRVTTLGEIASVRQGLITGADDIFLVPAALVPKSEKEIYIPFLSDREIEAYKVPARTKKFVIYPFVEGEPLDEDEIKKQFPQTWTYLLKHKKALTDRRSVRDAGNPWWRPIRPRQPENLLCPKIVTPHLVISPRFALDAVGRYAISHSPYIVPRQPAGLKQLMCILGLLNSSPCFWLISQNAHGYSRGYSRLEVTTLARTRVPDPAQMDHSIARRITQAVQARLESSGASALALEREIDDLAAVAYGLSDSDKRLVGIGVRE